MTLGVGQFCTKAGLVFVTHGVNGAALVAATIEALSSLGSFTMLSSSIADHFRRGAEAIAEISDVRASVQQEPGNDAHTAAQLYEVDAARFTGRDAYALREECFGPYCTASADAGALDRRANAPPISYELDSPCIVLAIG
jgi:acyl-CoA reductase-like NAD-dependent aldehyde dehydrogenase